jgi:hypothetical protein
LEKDFKCNIFNEIGISRLRAFENRVLRILFGPKREEVAGGWRRLQNEEPHNPHASPNRKRKGTDMRDHA